MLCFLYTISVLTLQIYFFFKLRPFSSNVNVKKTQPILINKHVDDFKRILY